MLKNWEQIKAAEKQDRGVLDGVPRSLPALQRAQLMGEKVSRVGFDWPDSRGSREKVSEEIRELDEAIASKDKERIESELGDLLFALVNLARHEGVNAEAALRGTADRFARRFAHVESRVKERHGGWPRGEDGKPAPGLAARRARRLLERSQAGGRVTDAAPSARLPEEWQAELAAMGQPRYRAQQVFRWIHQKGELDPNRMTDLPADLRAALAERRTSPRGRDPRRRARGRRHPQAPRRLSRRRARRVRRHSR